MTYIFTGEKQIYKSYPNGDHFFDMSQYDFYSGAFYLWVKATDTTKKNSKTSDFSLPATVTLE